MNIAIIGGGVAGLRAALELIPFHKVTIYEKSAGVGGRIATRRFGEVSVNHGARYFERSSFLRKDPVSEVFETHFGFSGAATDLPKAMRDSFLSLGGELILNAKVLRINDQKVILEDGTQKFYDAMMITAPVPQARELLQQELLPEVQYTREILFIGVKNGREVVEKLPDTLAENFFDLPEETIRAECPLNSEGLTLKKWKYARVKTGIPEYYHVVNSKLIIAGDSFDPEGYFDIASAWMSGRMAGSSLV